MLYIKVHGVQLRQNTKNQVALNACIGDIQLEINQLDYTFKSKSWNNNKQS